MQGQEQVSAAAEPEAQDLFDGVQRERCAILEEQHMTTMERQSELDAMEQVLAAWMIVATLGLAALAISIL